MEKAINKATDPADSFPKDKHVRTIIVSCPTEQACMQVYRYLLDKVRKGNPVTQMKAIQILHRVMLDGPEKACQTPVFDLRWVPELERFKRSQQLNMSTDIFCKYVRMLETKVQMHTAQQIIPGSMDPEIFKKTFSKISTENCQKLNPIIQPMLNHLKMCVENTEGILKILNSKKIFSLIAMLVTLIRELSGVYYMYYHVIFTTFVKLHHDGEYKDIIAKFDQMHNTLKNLFDQVSVIRDVTALVTVPQLATDPPDFSVITLGRERSPSPPPQPKVQTPPPQPIQPQFTPFDFSEMNKPTQKPVEPTFQPFDFSKEAQAPPPPPVKVEKEVIVKIEKVVDNERINKLLKRIKELEEEINDLKMRIDQLKADQRRELKKVNEEKEKANNAKIAELEKLIEELKNQLTDEKKKDDVIKALQTQIAEKEAELEKKKNVETDLAAKEAELKKLEESLREIEALKDQMKFKNDEAERKNAELQKKVENEQEKIKELEKTYDEMKKMNEGKEGNLQELLRQLEEERTKVKNWEKKGEEFENYKKKQREYEEQNRVELAELKRQNELLAADLKNQVGLSEQQKTEFAGLSQKFAELSQDYEKFKVQDAKLQKELEDEKKKSDFIAQQLVDEKNSKLKLADELNEVQERYENTAKALEMERFGRETDYWLVVNAGVKGAEKEMDNFFNLFNDTSIEGNPNANKATVLRDLTLLNATGIAYKASVEKNHPKEAEKEVENFVSTIKMLLEDIKGAEMKNPDEKLKVEIRGATVELIASVRDMMGKCIDREKVGEAGGVFDIKMTKEKTLVEGIEESAEVVNLSGIDEDAERELTKAANSIMGLAKDLEKWLSQSKKGVSAEMDVNQAIMESAQAIAKATAALVNAAASAQKERVALGKKYATPTKPYAPNQIWSEGLVTAGKEVAEATKQIVTVANNNVTPGTEKDTDALIATSHEVAKCTAHLVTAARSKADFDSPTLQKVENASRGVNEATKLLVEAVKAIGDMKKQSDESINYGDLSDYQLVIKEREASIQVLKLRRQLDEAEQRLKNINKQRYAKQNN
ncbi:paramyosin, putative [Entamoeba invadens IP1]|uniref:Paramyosin, putative n=1 Tax=Entamoeba invadens IP1 TaxID=370355 RepID=A0A0A1TZV5_ENTIV|nr:paramyosin, putative [Entamoeba invadens IP1]ELP87131.1 paramyosin, putative [Entamoeba invadens IP1]|eukprot:XP_004253902.1 paramyosin, putative [Entamoeba invadens IP1]